MIIHLLGVPMDLGAGRRGVDMGPSAIRIAGIAERLRELGHRIVDDGDMAIRIMEELRMGDPHARYLREIARATSVLSRKVERIAAEGCFPLVLGGDHAIAVGTISGVAAHARSRRRKLGVLWVDAHADFERLAPAPFSVVCFRAKPAGRAWTEAELTTLNEAILARVNASGEIFISHTVLRGRFTLRVAIGNLQTTDRHVRRAWELIREALASEMR